MISFNNFSQLNELAYKGNIGIMELVAFHAKATPADVKELKRLVALGREKEAWALVASVTKIDLKEGEEVPGRQVSDKELVQILGKARTKSLLTNPFFSDYSSYQKAYKYGVNKVGFPWVEVYFYFDHIHKTPEGKIRPEIMVRFQFSYSGWKIINAHKHTRDKTPNENEKRWGPTAGWNYHSSWKKIEE